MSTRLKMKGRSGYILAGKLYKKNFERYLLLFNPDATGNPFLMRRDISILLEKLSSPATYDEMLALFPPFLNKNEKASLLSSLEERHVIETIGKPAKEKVSNEIHSDKSVEVWLHITNNCNLTCHYCFVRKSKKSIRKVTLGRIIRSLLDGFKHNRFDRVKIKFSGGEPLLRPDLIKYVASKIAQQKKNKSVSYSVLSNGTLINERIISMLKTYDMGIGISIDGCSEVHDKMRKDSHGNGSFRQIEKNIGLLKESGINPFIMATISEETVEHLPLLTHWLLDNKLYSRYSFVRYQNYGLRDYKRFCGKIVCAIQESLMEIKKHPFGPAFVLEWKLADLSFKYPITRQPCGIGKSHFVINQKGELSLCPMSLDSPVGNITEDIFSCYRKFEQSYDQTDNDDVSCRNCQWHGVCGTGCPLLNEELFGRPNCQSPFCSAYKAIIPAYIDTYGWALEQLSHEQTPTHKLEKKP